MAQFSQPHRAFKLWDYNPTHKQLLFRSQKEDVPRNHSTRIDVRFWGVQRAEIFTHFRGLKFDIRHMKNAPDSHQTRRYVLTCDKGRMVIQALDVLWLEDDLEFDQPSGLE